MSNQIEKFNARAAKATKQYKDEEAIKETEMKMTTLEGQGKKVATKYGLSTEDIFMIIARDGMANWTKMWNNSMETVIKETMRNEVKSVVRETIQEELAAAVRGFMRGMAMNEIQSAVEEAVEEPVEFELEPFESEIKYAASTVVEEKPRYKEFNGEYKFRNEEKLNKMITEMHLNGEHPDIAKDFKAKGSTYNTMYQHFMKDNPGRGVWKQYVDFLLNNQ